MRVSFDGMRRNATHNVNNLQRIIIEMMARYDMYETDEENLITAFDKVANSMSDFNMLHDDKEKNDMNDLSRLNVKRLGE